ncbi:LYR motif-containing protein 4 [Coccinella septempunctata]|uniref:LYR motif-containing protein 4 n=1 Tax=Coccinella septempunctata TaxID=41139 RepID=UPI001D06237F|nr:LYR motif-containing protein 4 [Coccinella septempunctata]
MSPNRIQILSLYKTLLREASKFSSYNFRNYALRRIKDSFKENKNLNNEESIESHLSEARKNLEIIKRQVLIGRMYDTDKLVIEHETKYKSN